MRGFLTHQMPRNKFVQTVSVINKGLSPQGRRENVCRRDSPDSAQFANEFKVFVTSYCFFLEGFGGGRGGMVINVRWMN